MLLHASCVAIGGKGVLLAGPPGRDAAGIGKSDLALRLIDGGAQLVADDRTDLRTESGALLAAPPAAIAGLIELRHIGIVRMPFAADVPVALYVELAGIGEEPERMPEEEPVFLLDRPVRRLRLAPFALSTPAKIRACLAYPMVQ